MWFNLLSFSFPDLLKTKQITGFNPIHVNKNYDNEILLETALYWQIKINNRAIRLIHKQGNII